MTYYYSGYDKSGYDCYGYDRDGRDRDGYDRGGYDCDGRDRDGYCTEGYKDGYDRDGYDRDGYDRSGCDRDGYDRGGYDKDGYDRGGYDCDGYDKAGYDKGGYDRGGYDKYGYDCDGYDRGGYDKDGYDRGGYDKDGYDCDGYDRGGRDKDGYDKNGYDDCGCPRDGGVNVMYETFANCDLDANANVVSDDNWYGSNGLAMANGCSEGALTFKSFDGSNLDSATITLTMATSDICKFEGAGYGSAQDFFYVQVWDGAEWVTLDTFTRVGNSMVGDQTGQYFNSYGWNSISYTVTDPADDAQFRVISDTSASDEVIGIADFSITGVESCEPEPVICEPEYVSLLTETFDGLCDPAESANVLWDDGWASYYDAAYANGCSDGSIAFGHFDASEYDSVQISFDAGSSDICNWEGAGQANADYVKVELLVDGAWVTLDTFSRVGNDLVGDQSGQKLVNGYWGEINYTYDHTSAWMKLKVTASMTAGDESIWLDNVEITGVKEANCEPELGSIGDTIWLDADYDGIQDADEAGVAGITVELIKDGVATGITQVTDANGNYLFTDLEAGDYAIQVSNLPTDYVFTLQNLGGEAEDSDVNAAGLSDTFTLAEGENRTDLDAGLFDLSSVVELGSIGDRVWYDDNGNGLQDAGEAGVDGATVALLLDGVATGATATTDSNGNYVFTDLEAGNYSVQVTSALAANEAFTTRNAGDDLADSDVDGSGLSDSYALAEGEDYMGLDAGIVRLGSIGDTIWYDTDGDGVQDAGEAGVEGVTVELLKDGVATGRTVTTGANGTYLFDGLVAGDYAVQVSDIPEGYEVTAQNAGGDEGADSDIDASGLSDTYALGVGEDYFDLDGGIVASTPTVADDNASFCWTEAPALDVLSNDDAGLTITAIDGVAVSAGDTVTTAAGASLTINADGTVSYDGVDVWASLEFNTMGMDSFTYTATTAQGGSATATVDLMICADNIKTLEDINEIKPDLVEFTVTDVTATGGLFEVDVTAPGYERFERVDSTDVYCVDVEGDVLSGVTLTSELFLADENDASLEQYVAQYYNLDLVTYVLNQDYLGQGYSTDSIQTAIWNLTDGYLDGILSFIDADAQAIVDEATLLGEGFEAGEGDLVGLILAPIQQVDPATGEDTTNYQNFIYGVEYESFTECLCV
ncbi:SdrD B-like domain-containing protein [Rhodovulum sp. DZ06]|uniref:SdrD B-like domain-containing protein n=1 Tax=Rhodovulum sp. DZ06 TaxID=3425126 RepID=UPI003D345ADA